MLTLAYNSEVQDSRPPELYVSYGHVSGTPASRRALRAGCPRTQCHRLFQVSERPDSPFFPSGRSGLGR
jgi:hypothetical protein